MPMSRNEALKQIEALKQYIIELDSHAEEDIITLLSAGEYTKYRQNIEKYCTPVKCAWWLRSPAAAKGAVDMILSNEEIGWADYDDDRIGIRPMLRLKENYGNAHIGHVIYKAINSQHTLAKLPIAFVCICTSDNAGHSLWLANTPVAWGEFDSTNNEYATSNIRDWLKNHIIDYV